MVLEDPLYQDGNDYPAQLDRQFIEDVFDTEGVIKTTVPGALLVTPRAAGANMSVDIAAGRAVVKGDDQANQGSYRVISTAVENRPIGAAPGSDSRIDLVVARVRDAAVTGGVSSDWVIEVIPGAVAVTPVAPAVPNTAIPLAQVLVAAGTLSIDAAKITDRRATAGNAAYIARAFRQSSTKPADESVASSTVLQNDDHLSFTVAAGETWVWSCDLFVNGPVAGDIAVAFSFPAGTGRWFAHGLDLAATGATGSLKSDGEGASGIAVSFGVHPTRQSLITIKGYIAATAAGVVQLQWAQAVADATATQVRVGSQLIAQRTN